MIKVVILGSGNVASHLIKAMEANAAIDLVQVYARSKKSLENIYKTPAGTYEGVIEKLLTGDTNRKCVNCTGEKKDQRIAGMIVVTGMIESDLKLSGGKILDPANGKVYNCTMSFDSKTGKLKVRGSLDKSGLIGRNQSWIRAEN